MKYLKNNWLVVALIALSLTPVLWFVGKGGMLINGLDTNFPLDPIIWFQRRFFVWNESVNAGVYFPTAIAGLFFHLIQVVPYLLGFGLQATEIINVIFWFSAIVFAGYAFARAIVPKNSVAQFLFVIIYSYNIYLYNTWENIKVANLALVVALPLFLAILENYRSKRLSLGKLILFSTLAGIVASGSGINPAYFITLNIGVVIYTFVSVLVSKVDPKRVLIGSGVSLLFLFLINMYWILPFVDFGFFSSGGLTLESAGFANWVESLSKNTSLVNVFRLQGAWDWYITDAAGLPLYIPYALNYFRKPLFIAFSFVLPALAIVSFIFHKRSKGHLYLLSAVLLVLGLFMGAGLHDPTGQLYVLFLKYLPYFSFFRSPWYIFSPFLILAFATLVGLLYLSLEDSFTKYRTILVGVAMVFAVGHVLYSYPIWTGKIYRPSRSDTFYVEFPEYLWDSKEWLSEDGPGRILSYPDDDLEKFEWGYKGTESILSLFSDREVIAPSFVFSGNLKVLLDRFYSHLKREEYDSAMSMMPFFGADTLFVKRDASSLAPQLDGNKLGNLGAKTSYGEWDFYKFTGPPVAKIFSPEYVYANISTVDAFPAISPILQNRSVVVNQGDSEIGKIENIESLTTVFFEAIPAISKANSTDPILSYEITVPKNGDYYLAVEKDGFDIQDIAVFSSTLNLEEVERDESDTFLILGPIFISRGSHEFKAVFPKGKNLVKVDNFEKFYDVPNLRENELPKDIAKTIVAYNNSEDPVSVEIPMGDFDPHSNYVLSFDYKYYYGSVPTVAVAQFAPSSPLKVEAFDAGLAIDWEHIQAVFEPVPVDSKVSVIINMPMKPTGDESKAFLENFSFVKVYDNRAFLVEKDRLVTESPVEISYTKVSPVEYLVEVEGITDDYFLAFLDNYSPKWKLEVVDGIGKPIHFSINGYANGWYVPGNSESQQLRIYFQPQIYFMVGMGISTLTLICAFVWLKK